MHAPLPLLLALAFLLLAAIILGRKGRQGAIEAKPILTENEREFFYRLARALPNHHVFPQVALGALLKVRGSRSKAYYSARGRFSGKIADFVVCERATLEIVAVIELDDKTHAGKAEQDARRDAMLQSAGYRTLRFHSRRKPSSAEIAALFQSETPRM